MSPRDLTPPLDELLARCEQALERLNELPLHFSPSDIHRDAAIHRFRAAFEILWRAAQRHLVEIEGLDMASPMGVIRASGRVDLLHGDDRQAAVQMGEDRNLVNHVYDDANAKAIYARVQAHAELMRRWLDAMVGE